MKILSPWKEPLKIGGSIILAVLGLLVFPQEYGNLASKLRAASSYGEYSMSDDDYTFFIARNSSSNEVDFYVDEVQSWLVYSLELESAIGEPEPGKVPPLTQVIVVAEGVDASQPRIVKTGGDRFISPGKLLIATEHEDFVRFSLLILLLALVGLVALVATSYIHGRSEPMIEKEGVRNGRGDK